MGDLYTVPAFRVSSFTTIPGRGGFPTGMGLDNDIDMKVEHYSKHGARFSPSNETVGKSQILWRDVEILFGVRGFTRKTKPKSCPNCLVAGA